MLWFKHSFWFVFKPPQSKLSHRQGSWKHSLCIHPLASILSEVMKDWNLIRDKLSSWPRGLAQPAGLPVSGKGLSPSRFLRGLENLQHCSSQEAAQISSLGSLPQTLTAKADCYWGKPLGKRSLFQPNGSHQIGTCLAIPLSPPANLKSEKIHSSCTAHLPLRSSRAVNTTCSLWVALGFTDLKEIPLTSVVMSNECCNFKTLCECTFALLRQ